jgi:hypothetical protein
MIRQYPRGLFQQHRSKPVSLGVSKCFPVCPRKRTSDPSQSAPGFRAPRNTRHRHGGALGRALARRARPRLRHLNADKPNSDTRTRSHGANSRPLVPAKAGTQIGGGRLDSRLRGNERWRGAATRHAATAPNRSRFAFCCSLRGGSLNRRAAVPPRMLCFAFSDRNGRSQTRLGRSKSQCG